MSVTRPRPLVLGAVATDPKVVTVWETFQSYFIQRGLPFEYVLYSSYEQQVLSHFDGHCHVALNSPLAWIEAERLAVARGRKASAIAMRDSDRDLCSVIVARRDSGISGIGDLRGKRVAVGAKDSPQATLIPLELIAQAGLEPGKDIEVIYFNAGAGKHGARVADERDAAKALDERQGGRLLFARRQSFATCREGTCRRPPRRSSPRPSHSITATSPCWTARPNCRSSASSRCCWRCLTPTRRRNRCSIWKA